MFAFSHDMLRRKAVRFCVMQWSSSALRLFVEDAERSEHDDRGQRPYYRDRAGRPNSVILRHYGKVQIPNPMIDRPLTAFRKTLCKNIIWSLSVAATIAKTPVKKQTIGASARNCPQG